MNAKVNDRTQAPGDVTIERLPAAREVRRAADALRLTLAVVVLLAAQLLAILARAGVRNSEGSLLRAITTLPPSLRDVLTVAGQVVVVLLPAGMVVAVLVRRRPSRWLAAVVSLKIAQGRGYV